MELLLAILFLLAVAFSGAKINRDFGSHGLPALLIHLIFTAIYAALVGLPYS